MLPPHNITIYFLSFFWRNITRIQGNTIRTIYLIIELCMSKLREHITIYLSLIKWRSILTCIVLSWWKKFFAIVIAKIYYHYKTLIGQSSHILTWSSKHFSHIPHKFHLQRHEILLQHCYELLLAAPRYEIFPNIGAISRSGSSAMREPAQSASM